MTGLPPRLRSVLPALLLTVVAANQIRQTFSNNLTPWKGGGFGMFSTLDASTRRAAQIRVSVDGQPTRVIETSAELQAPLLRALTLPTDTHLKALAEAVIAAERAKGRAVDLVQIECWRTRYALGTLIPSQELLREYYQSAGQ